LRKNEAKAHESKGGGREEDILSASSQSPSQWVSWERRGLRGSGKTQLTAILRSCNVLTGRLSE